MQNNDSMVYFFLELESEQVFISVTYTTESLFPTNPPISNTLISRNFHKKNHLKCTAFISRVV